MLAILIYLVAVSIPAYCLYHFHAKAWYWHLLAVAIGLALGFVSIPPELQKRGFDLLVGSVIVMCLFWGIGGFFVQLGHREKHA